MTVSLTTYPSSTSNEPIRIKDIHTRFTRLIGSMWTGGFSARLGNILTQENRQLIESYPTKVNQDVRVTRLCQQILQVDNLTRYGRSKKVPLPQKTYELASNILLGKATWNSNAIKEIRKFDSTQGKVVLVSIDKAGYIQKKYQSKDVQEREYRLLQSLKPHPSIVPIAYAEPERLFFEYVDGMKFNDWKVTTLPHYMNLLHQTSSAVEFLHKNRIVHSDIKGDNVLLTQDQSQVKIIDFGMAFSIDKYQPIQWDGDGSYHLPPEYLDGKMPKKHCQTVDTWSLGMLALLRVTTTRRCPWVKKSPGYSVGNFIQGSLEGQIHKDYRGYFETEGLSWINMIKRCLSASAEERPTAEEMTNCLQGLK